MIDFNDLEPICEKAISSLFDIEQDLLFVDANERSISHKLAEHLLRAISERYDFDIDCEYNRHDLDPKRLDLRPFLDGYPAEASTHDDKGTTVYPDIIIHRRRKKVNLLVIEIKKSTSYEQHDRDLMKLMEFVRHPDFDYEFGLFLEVGTGKAIKKGLWTSSIWFHYDDGDVRERLRKTYEAPFK